jgi:hypothetical protein
MTDDIAATTPLDLDKAQALADAASPGPWEAYPNRDVGGIAHVRIAQAMHPTAWPSDAEFIAQARTLVPALIAELRPNRDHWKVRAETAEIEAARLKEELREVRAELNRWVESA